MSQEFNIERWNHTAYICTVLHNVNCEKESQLKSMEDFHPFIEKKKSSMELTKEGFKAFAGSFKKKEFVSVKDVRVTDRKKNG